MGNVLRWHFTRGETLADAERAAGKRRAGVVRGTLACMRHNGFLKLSSYLMAESAERGSPPVPPKRQTRLYYASICGNARGHWS